MSKTQTKPVFSLRFLQRELTFTPTPSTVKVTQLPHLCTAAAINLHHHMCSYVCTCVLNFVTQATVSNTHTDTHTHLRTDNPRLSWTSFIRAQAPGIFSLAPTRGGLFLGSEIRGRPSVTPVDPWYGTSLTAVCRHCTMRSWD